MTDTTTAAEALALYQVKALRNADDVTFRFNDGRCYIQATKQTDPNDGFGARPIDIEIPAEPKWSIHYLPGAPRAKPRVAFYSCSSAQFRPEWVTATKFLKVGDELILHWTKEHSERVRDAGLQTVEFRMEVRRRGARGTSHYVFLLGADVEPAGSEFTIEY